MICRAQLHIFSERGKINKEHRACWWSYRPDSLLPIFTCYQNMRTSRYVATLRFGLNAYLTGRWNFQWHRFVVLSALALRAAFTFSIRWKCRRAHLLPTHSTVKWILCIHLISHIAGWLLCLIIPPLTRSSGRRYSVLLLKFLSFSFFFRQRISEMDLPIGNLSSSDGRI